jgi:hypothetical protein
MDIVCDSLPDGKVCSKCRQWKPRSEYGFVESNPDKMRYACKGCYNGVRKDYRNGPGREAIRKQKSRAYHKDPDKTKRIRDDRRDKRRNARIKCLYGITNEEFDRILEKQGGGCAICGAKVGDSLLRNLRIDHCHSGGHVRGLLCHGCNAGIGFLGDSVERLLEAALYLERDRRHHPHDA